MTTQRFSHKERRFLISTRPIDSLERTLGKGRAYHVSTTYLDTPERTWSALTMSSDMPKIRFRVYDGKDMFLEKKLHVGHNTTKERIAVDAMPEGLIAVAAIEYDRTEHLIDGVRVTVDRNVRSDARSLARIVVEIKGHVPKTLSFLSPFTANGFSKYKWFSGQWNEDESRG